MTILKKTSEYLAVMLLAVLAAVNYTIFVFPNSFAPSGVDGVCTMIQDVTKVSMGYLSLVVNIPLLILAYIFLSREFAIKNTVFVVTFSVAIVYLRSSFIAALAYHTDSGTSIVLAPIAAGVIRGVLYVLTLRLCASSGGVDIIAALVKKKIPHYNFMNIIFFINMIIAISAYFVYGFRIEPVICSIVYAFVTSTVTKHIQSSGNENVKFEIITPDAQKLYSEISEKLGLPATVMDARGAYSGTDKKMVMCVTDKKQAPLLEYIIYEFPDTVVFKSTVNMSLHS